VLPRGPCSEHNIWLPFTEILSYVMCWIQCFEASVCPVSLRDNIAMGFLIELHQFTITADRSICIYFCCNSYVPCRRSQMLSALACWKQQQKTNIESYGIFQDWRRAIIMSFRLVSYLVHDPTSRHSVLENGIDLATGPLFGLHALPAGWKQRRLQQSPC
jgi:hypothetical protein